MSQPIVAIKYEYAVEGRPFDHGTFYRYFTLSSYADELQYILMTSDVEVECDEVDNSVWFKHKEPNPSTRVGRPQYAEIIHVE